MKIRVILFASLKDLADTDELVVDLPEPVTVGRLRREIDSRHPSLAGLLQQSLVAVNEEYASDEQVVVTGDEIACIPPVSGG